jgi:hypothetical protein
VGEAGGPEVWVLFAEHVMGSPEAANGLGKLEGEGAQDVWRSLGDGLMDRRRQTVEREHQVSLCGVFDPRGAEAEILLCRFAHQRFVAYGRVLQIRSRLAFEFREARQVEDVVRQALVGEVGEFDRGEAHHSRLGRQREEQAARAHDIARTLDGGRSATNSARRAMLLRSRQFPAAAELLLPSSEMSSRHATDRCFVVRWCQREAHLARDCNVELADV